MRLRFQLTFDLHLLGWNYPRRCFEVEFVPLHQPNFLRACDSEDADLDTAGSNAAIILQTGHHLWHLRVGRRPVSLLAMQLPGRGQHVFEVATPCGRVLARAKLQRLGSVHQPFDPLAPPRRRDRLHAPDRLERLQHLLSCDLVNFQIMQARFVADGARPLLLLFLRQTLAPAGVLLLGKFLERLAALGDGSLLDARIDAIALQGDPCIRGPCCARCSTSVRRRPRCRGADPGELHLRPFAVKVREAEGPHPVTALAHD